MSPKYKQSTCLTKINLSGKRNSQKEGQDLRPRDVKLDDKTSKSGVITDSTMIKDRNVTDWVPRKPVDRGLCCIQRRNACQEEQEELLGAAAAYKPRVDQRNVLMLNCVLLLRESVATGSAELADQVLDGRYKMSCEEFTWLCPPEVQAALDQCLLPSACFGSTLPCYANSSEVIQCALKCSNKALTLEPRMKMTHCNLDQCEASVLLPSQAVDLHNSGPRSSCPGSGCACCTCEKLDNVNELNKPGSGHGNLLHKDNTSTWFSR